MTNTKTRKRVLLSSVAMLLVALVALGSATFAWFNTKNSADAHTIKAQTTKGSDISLSETGAGGWTHDLTFTNNTLANTQAITPVTTSDFSNWNYVLAAQYDSGYASASYTAVNDPTNAPTFIKYGVIYVKSNKDQEVKVTPQVTMASGHEMAKEYLRVAFVPMATTETNVTQKPFDGNIIWSTDNEDRSAETNGWNASGQPAHSIITTVNNFTQTSLGTFEANKIAGYKIYVWVEGTDFECIDSNSGVTASVSFAFAGTVNS